MSLPIAQVSHERARSAARELDRLAVRRRARGAVPLPLAFRQLVRENEALLGHEPLQRGEPVLVVAAAVVRLAALLRGRDLTGEQGRELLPGELPALVEHDGKRERLSLPGRGKYRPLLVARN